MPNIKSAKKRVLVQEKKTAQNRATMSALRTSLKKANAALDNNDADKAVVVKEATKKIDKAAAKGLITKNSAARKKSALARKAN